MVVNLSVREIPWLSRVSPYDIWPDSLPLRIGFGILESMIDFPALFPFRWDLWSFFWRVVEHVCDNGMISCIILDQCRHKQNTSPMDLMWWEWTSVELVKWRRGEVGLVLQCVSHSEGPPEILISCICLRWFLTFHHGKSPLKLPFLYQTYKAKNIGIPILKTDQQFFFYSFRTFWYMNTSKIQFEVPQKYIHSGANPPLQSFLGPTILFSFMAVKKINLHPWKLTWHWKITYFQ